MQKYNHAGVPSAYMGSGAAAGGGLKSTAAPLWLRFCAIALLTAGVSACAHAKAATVAELPPLDMPSPPPRVVEAAEPQQPPLIALPGGPSSIERPAPPPRAESPRSAEPARPEAPVEAAKPAEETPRPSPATTLQTTPTQREGEMERRIRILIAQAFNDLNRVNYQALNANARNQYDTAKRFAIQAEESLQARNLVFASNLADKAAALAAQLQGR